MRKSNKPKKPEPRSYAEPTGSHTYLARDGQYYNGYALSSDYSEDMQPLFVKMEKDLIKAFELNNALMVPLMLEERRRELIRIQLLWNHIRSQPKPESLGKDDE